MVLLVDHPPLTVLPWPQTTPAASLSPFDGWTADNIQACQWKDYVYANQNSLECDW